jgi:hypothetical protein
VSKPRTSLPRLRALALALATLAGVAAVALSTSPARAATLFSDDFEQPTGNVWQTGGGGSWAVVSEDGSRVFRQSNTEVDTAAWAGSGAGAFTVVTAKVKPDTGTGYVALLSRVANPNNFYYVALRSDRLDIGRRSLGTVSSLASVPFTATTGAWYTVSLNLFFTGTVRGSVSPAAGGGTVSVSAPDPGGTNFGGAVGFWTVNAGASFDDIVLADDRIVPTTTRAPTGGCAVAAAYTIVTRWTGYFQGGIALRNISAATIPAGWVLTFRFAAGESIVNLHPGTWRQEGPLVTVTGPPWGALPSGASFGLGLIARAPNGPSPITDITFNGVRCA